MEDQLEQAQKIKDTVAGKGVNEVKIALYWGLFTLVFFSLFSFLEAKNAGVIISIGAAIGGILTVYHVLSRRDVKIGKVKPWYNHPSIWFWIVATPWTAGLFTLAMLNTRFDWGIPYAFVIAGVLSALPMIFYGKLVDETK